MLAPPDLSALAACAHLGRLTDLTFSYRELGDAGLASPVSDWSGRVVGAIGIVGPVERLLTPAGRRVRLADAVRSTARALSRDLGAGR